MEPACAVLEISPSTYYAAKKREEYPSARDVRDEELKMAIMRARERKGRRLYGAKKMWRELNRDGIEVARCTVERLMREMGLEGLRQGSGVFRSYPVLCGMWLTGRNRTVDGRGHATRSCRSLKSA